MPDDPISDAINLGYLVAFVVLGYVVWKIYDSVMGTTADNGQQKCTYAQYSGGQCVSGDGSNAPCGFLEYWTATSCYAGTPTAQPSGSVVGGIGSLFTGANSTPAAPTPGLPAGYDPTTGTITQ